MKMLTVIISGQHQHIDPGRRPVQSKGGMNFTPLTRSLTQKKLRRGPDEVQKRLVGLLGVLIETI